MAQLARIRRLSFDDAIGVPYGAADPRLIDAMVAARRKTTGRAYRRGWFGGLFGVHNFYLGKPVLGGLQACALPFCVVAFDTAVAMGPDMAGGGAVVGAGLAALAALGLSLLVDAFLIPARVDAYSDRLRAQFEAEADWRAA
jgi:TM2 domain-containing membrane protein YozV